MSLFDTIGIDGSYVVIGLAAFSILLLILIIVLFVKNSNLRKKYEVFMQDSDAQSLEKLFANKLGQVDGLIKKSNELDNQIAQINERLTTNYNKVAIVKYDAFDMGGKLSFALAMLNDKHDGFILNSMHSTREGCYTYVKEIINGESFVILAKEEKEALDTALNSNL